MTGGAMVITSVSNEKVKNIRRLLQKKYRAEENAFLLEGVKPVREAVGNGREILYLFGTERALSRVDFGGDKITVSESVFASVSEEKNPEGVFAAVRRPDTTPKQSAGRCILLDGVRDPGNLGAIIRTAAAAGYKQVYLRNCADPFNPKTVRASMSGIFGVSLYETGGEDFKKFITVPIYAADMGGENVFSMEKREACIALGGEADGLTAEVLAAAEKVVSVPMEKESESLNVAVAAGIMMYALK